MCVVVPLCRGYAPGSAYRSRTVAPLSLVRYPFAHPRSEDLLARANGLRRDVDKLVLPTYSRAPSRVNLRNGERLRALSTQKLLDTQSAHDRGGGFTHSMAVSRGSQGYIDTTLTPSATQYGATQGKAQKRKPFRNAAFASLCKLLQRLMDHS